MTKKPYPEWRQRPKSLTERGYRKYMARTKQVTVNGTEFTLQSVSPSWYYELNDRCGNTGNSSKKDSVKYMDELFRNVVIAPADVSGGGMKHFDDEEDLKTPEALLREIESFLREGKQPSRSAKTSKTE